MSDTPVIPEYVHEATAAKLAAEADFFAAQAEAQRQLARKDAVLADEYELRQGELRFKDSLRTAGNLHHGVVYFPDAVTGASVEGCISHLDFFHRTRPGAPMEIIFTSPGGDVIAGMRLFDHITYLRGEGHKIDVGTRGVAASMAGILLQAGETRWMGKQSWVLIHQISAGVHGSYGEIKDMVKWFEMMQDRILDVFAARAKEAGENGTASHPITRRQLEKNWTRTDWWISSDDCLKLGIVDEVR